MRRSNFPQYQKHIDYFKYLLKHKYWVAHMLFQRKLFIQGIMHDMSKFKPREFIKYAEHLSTNKKLDIKETWVNHIHVNKHHWQYWVLLSDEGNMQALEMPENYVIEMIADWYSTTICEKGFDRLQENVFRWYMERKDKLFLHQKTRQFLEENIIIVAE